MYKDSSPRRVMSNFVCELFCRIDVLTVDSEDHIANA